MRRHESTAVHNNMFGYRGVEWDGERKKYRARIEPANGQRGKWLGRFETAAAAAAAYDAAAKEIYGNDAYLNFPMNGEMQSRPSRRNEGVCPKGHDLSVEGYRRPDGRGVTCRKCNTAASLRSYRKRMGEA